MKKALVTGSSGFVGTILCSRLVQREYIVTEFDIVRGEDNQDVRNKQAVEEAVKGQDVVFNLASLLGTHELIEDRIVEAVEINVIGTLNVLEAAKKHNVDVVEIGKPNVWLDTYTITKRAAESFALMYAKEHGVKAWVVKWFNIFGPGQHYGKPQKLAPTSIVKALKGENIPVFGSGDQTVDFIFVDDAADAAIAIYESEDAMAFPVDVGHHSMSVNKFVEKVIELSGSESKVEYFPMRRGEDNMTIIKAKQTFLNKVVGYTPKSDFEQSLKATIEWYKAKIESGTL